MTKEIEIYTYPHDGLERTLVFKDKSDILYDLNLSYTNLYQADLSDSNAMYTKFNFANIVAANFQRINASHAIFTNANLHQSNLTDGIFIRATCIETNFNGATLVRTDFTNANLSHANFTKADLRGTNFTNADLTGARFTGANTKGAIFTGAKLNGVNLTQTTNGMFAIHGGLYTVYVYEDYVLINGDMFDANGIDDLLKMDSIASTCEYNIDSAILVPWKPIIEGLQKVLVAEKKYAKESFLLK